MSVSQILILIAALVLVLVGLALMLAGVGINLIGAHVPLPWWGDILVGLLFFIIGVYVARGGTIGP